MRDEDGDETVYERPESDLVRPLMHKLVDELEHWDDNSDQQPILVTAAMTHLNLVMIHPFRDGNGRMARCLQTLILGRNQILGAEFSSIEEWLGRNTQAYYDILTTTGEGAWNPDRDATRWVKFNLRAHYMQAQTVDNRVRMSEQLWLLMSTARKSRADAWLNGPVSKPIASLFSLLVIVVAAACIAGDPEWSGPVLFRLTHDHGVHLSDLAVAAFAASALTLIWRSTRR